ncbi:hypothetical protein CcaverHIS002_0107150 [Cutaneotrichosporon cavernicola]|uniref:NADH-ubiquinone oxidoreductase B15 subunit n=1 Tax=Cutaneotrichosporon cavernicola TaxID=279322 RepID=A0AA48II09_9TREE|nr:uncharacterized protein CcaverHIS019_0107110 [Cutaneotrichosporon cavernicola]BEI80186.1 hypothetical protein CcaverHIS002_0107150 [Cutaneotrichosporon cavernicola]BEI87993.1 hypothetical protein CcaverHIS019_0107110 [Cutaneotrichosporon cavernicola]BEI95769.1 hypothetical protein CcaverHIS631_0107180 [Cutaneotrichosporon cavernicola]BEJ03541.1 hypothetical protein CcaverHIS641_0107160 [Cutaneotrichosporon cavernicola]
MAGHNNPLLVDPSIDRWAAMRENVYQHFKFSRAITYKVLRWAVIVPGITFAVASIYDGKLDWAGKRREDSLLANPPKKEEAQE